MVCEAQPADVTMHSEGSTMTDEVTVRVCTADDLDVLMTSAATNDVGHRHHLAQWELQITGQATYLVVCRLNS